MQMWTVRHWVRANRNLFVFNLIALQSYSLTVFFRVQKRPHPL
jgi:hypothetical protein